MPVAGGNESFIVDNSLFLSIEIVTNRYYLTTLITAINAPSFLLVQVVSFILYLPYTPMSPYPRH